MRIRDLFDPGSGMFGSGKNIPDPQHCPRIFKIFLFVRHLRGMHDRNLI
jgi:hypothetical protein